MRAQAASPARGRESHCTGDTHVQLARPAHRRAASAGRPRPRRTLHRRRSTARQEGGGERGAAAHEAFPSWSTSAPSERSAVLMHAAHLLMLRTGRIVQTMAAESGAAGPWSVFNAKLAAQFCSTPRPRPSGPAGRSCPRPPGGPAPCRFAYRWG
ncbi:aldehyde dehydrogenase family protein [Streptomyces sp. NPDC001118]